MNVIMCESQTDSIRSKQIHIESQREISHSANDAVPPPPSPEGLHAYNHYSLTTRYAV